MQKKIGFSIANSPLVKTAIAGEDPNWGRIIMAIGKAGPKINLKKLCIKLGDIKIVQDIENKYRKVGVSGVPTFIINNDYVVPGAQSKEFWQGVLRELTQKYRRMYSWKVIA